MEKGWNQEYLSDKYVRLKERLEKETDEKKINDLAEELELCSFLQLLLFLSTGETIYEKCNMKSFVEEMYGKEFSFNVENEELEKMKNITPFYSKLPNIDKREINTFFSVNDATEIVGDFICNKFGNNHYDSFKNAFFNNNYVLYDKASDLSEVTYLDDEVFIRINKSDDIKMLSSIAHEAGHVYRIMHSDNKFFDNIFKEFESFFYEFNFLLWLINNNIYKEEARNHFLYLFDTLEKIVYMRYIIKNHKLYYIKDYKKYNKIIKELHIKKNLNIKKNEEFFNTYITTINVDLMTYFNSFIATLDNLDDINLYEKVISIIGNDNESEIKKMILKNNNSFDTYFNYRNYLQKNA